MPVLYNMHTHCLSSDNTDGYDIVDILNTYPSSYDEEKKEHPFCLFSCGIHPRHADDHSLQQSRVLEAILAQNKDVIAVGEVGLDKLQGEALFIQSQVFEQQVRLAIDYCKPIIIHCVRYWDELIAIKRKYRSKQAWIIHGYRGNTNQAKQLSELGFLFSVGYFFNQDAVKQLPFESLFCETDDRNTPIIDVYRKVADAKEIDLDSLASIVEMNIKKTFFEK